MKLDLRTPLTALFLVALVPGCGSDPERVFDDGSQDAGTDGTATDAPGSDTSQGGDGTTDDTGQPDDTGTPADTGVASDTGATQQDGTTTDTQPTGDTGGTVTDTRPQDGCPATTLTVDGTAAPSPVWSGATTTITGSGVLAPAGTITYAFELTTRPAGSAAALTGAGATRALVTDKPGNYVVRVTGSAPCVANATKDVTITAHDATVFYEYLEDLSSNVGYLTVRKAGATQPLPANASARLPAYIKETGDVFAHADHASFAGDVWEGAPGTPSKVAFVWYSSNTSPNNSPRVLFGGTSTANAAVIYGPIQDLGQTVENGQSMKIAQPQFSPNGSRIAFLRIPYSKATSLVTVGSDGTTPKVVANYFAVTPSGNVDQSNTARPQWLTDTVLGWARQVNSNNWAVVTASDSTSSTVSTVFTCGANNGQMPRMFKFLPNNPTTNAIRVLVSFKASSTAPGDLILYEPLSAGGTCNQVANLTNYPNNKGVKDFTLSPDRTKVVWISDAVYMRNSDGSGTNTTIPVTSFGNSGPRFVAGGSRIVLTLNGSPSTFPLTGTPVTTLETPPANVKVSHFGNGGCSTAGSPTGLGLVAAGLGAGLLLSRRRRHDEV